MIALVRWVCIVLFVVFRRNGGSRSMADVGTTVRRLANAIVDRLFDPTSKSCDAIEEEYRKVVEDTVLSYQQEGCNFSSSSSLRSLIKSRDARNFVKGETFLQDFLKVFTELQSLLLSSRRDSHNLIFIDLGSGDGECLLAAAVCRSLYFNRIIGYEVNHARVLESKVLLSVLQALYPQDITFSICEQDFLAVTDWVGPPCTDHEAVYVIYACATCYTVDTIMGIYKKALEIKALSQNNLVYLILLDQELESIVPLSHSFSSSDNTHYGADTRNGTGSYCKVGNSITNILTSWGEGTARIYQIIL